MANERMKNELRLLERAVSATQNGVMITDASEPDDPIVWVNGAFEKITGYSSEEVLGRNPRFLQAGDNDQPALSDLRASRESNNDGIEWTGVLRNYRKNGTLFHNELVAAAVRDEDGRATNHVGVMTDVTESVRAEEERLRVSREYEEMVRVLPNVVFRCQRAPDGGIHLTYSEGALAQEFGVDTERAAERPLGELFPPEFLSTVVPAFKRAFAGETVEFPSRIGDRSFSNVAMPFHTGRRTEGRGREGRRAPAEEIVGCVTEVTERERAEEALRRSEERFRSLIQNASDVVTVLDADGTVRYQSLALERLMGYRPEELVGEDIFGYVHPDDRQRTLDAFAESLSSPQIPVRVEFRFRHEDGSWRHLEATGSNLLSDPAVGGVVINSRDVTERVRAEEALRESERRFGQLFEHSVDAMLVLHPDTREVVDCNREAGRSLGYAREELLGLRLEDFAVEVLPEEEKERRGSDTPWRRALDGEPGTIIGFHENVHRRKDGTTFPVEVGVGSIDYAGMRMILASCRAVTERKRAEEALQESEERFRSLFEQAADAVFVHDLEGRLVDVNRRACESLGYDREELLSLSVEDVERNLEPGGFAGLWERLVSGGSFTLDGVHRRKDGTTFPVEVRVGLFEAGRRRLMLAVARDVTERKEAEEALRESEARFRALFEQSSDALLVHDDTGRMVDCNREACRSLGYAREELLSLSVEDFGLKLVSDEEGLDKDRMLWERVMDAEPGTVAGVVLGMHRRRDGTTFPVEVRVSGVDYGGRRLILASCRDLTERRALEGRLAHQAFHDPLTGLPNRALFSDRLKHALSRAVRGRECVAVLFLDLDDFKDVNDFLGHEAGDELLVAVAERLKGCIRPGDTAARLGGDEFVVLLEGSAGEGEALRVAERVKEALANPFALQGHEVFVTVSIGVAFNGSGTKEKPGELLREADVAMYEAKRGGKDRLRAFEEAMDAPALKRLEAQTDLRRALERGGEEEFTVLYQHKVALNGPKSGGIVCTEALVYWEHPERGLVPPTEFIPLAEETGLIVPLGRRVLREACRRAVEWQALCPEEPPLMVSVNLSARQFEHEDLAQDVARTLEESGLAAAHLILEITESVVMEDAPRTARIMGELKALGVRLSIDDFGTGYSSLSYLRRFPVDYLKIDRSFVEGLGEDAGDAVVASGIVSMAHAMGLEVVAEGVETEGQLAKLKEMGCDMAQGYLFAEPLPPEAAAELLAAAPRSGGGGRRRAKRSVERPAPAS